MITWLRWLPQGWAALPIGIGLLLLMAAFIRFGPPGVLTSRTGLRLPEAQPLGASREDLVRFGRTAGRRAYRAELWWDLLFALAYGAGLIALVNGTFGASLRSPGQLFGLGLIPFGVVTADLLEDALLLHATRPQDLDQWGSGRALLIVARAMTAAKFALFGLSLFLVVVGAISLALLGSGNWEARLVIPLGLASLAFAVFHLVFTMLIPPRAKYRKEPEHEVDIEEELIIETEEGLFEADIQAAVVIPQQEVLSRTESTSLWWEVLSAVIKIALSALILFIGARWFLGFFMNAPESQVDAVKQIGIDHTGGWPWRLAIWGGSFSGAIVVAFLVAYHFVPRSLETVPDRKFGDMSGRAVAVKIVLILIGTVAFEELIFRGVLFAAWRNGYHPMAYAVVGSSIVFGLWHIGPALRGEEQRHPRSESGGSRSPEDHADSTVADRRASSVGGTVLAMFAAGVVLCCLRIWSRGIWAPALVHWTANSSGVVFSWIAAQRHS